MNTLYVVVSIPLLLILAGFNHAHGLTTFGKSGGSNQQQPPQQLAQPRSCTSQTNCTLIKGTTCLKGYCFCGDNTHPINGACPTNIHKGPRHICNKKEECVRNADCLPAKDQNKTISFGQLDKVCTCEEDYDEIGAFCAGSTSSIMNVLLVLIIFCRILN